MPTVQWLQQEFHYGYESGDILNPVPDEVRATEESRAGGSYHLLFHKVLKRFIRPDSMVLELGPGKGSWSRATLSVLTQGQLHTVDFQDVRPWLAPERWDGRLVCHQVRDNGFGELADALVVARHPFLEPANPRLRLLQGLARTLDGLMGRGQFHAGLLQSLRLRGARRLGVTAHLGQLAPQGADLAEHLGPQQGEIDDHGDAQRQGARDRGREHSARTTGGSLVCRGRRGGRRGRGLGGAGRGCFVGRAHEGLLGVAGGTATGAGRRRRRVSAGAVGGDRGAGDAEAR